MPIDFREVSGASKSAVTPVGFVTCPGATRANSSRRLCGFSTMPTTRRSTPPTRHESPTARWNADAEIQGLLKIINQQDAGLSKLTKKYSSGGAKKLLAAPLDRIELAKAPLPYDKLDQLTMEVIMGVR